jgi:hypothetical protein
MLLITNLTALYGQTGRDTLTSYNKSELKRIADRVVRARECDTLLSITETELKSQDQVISNLSQVISYKDSIIATKDSIVFQHNAITDVKNAQIGDLTDEVNKTKRKIKLIKSGWLASTVLLIALWLGVVF